MNLSLTSTNAAECSAGSYFEYLNDLDDDDRGDNSCSNDDVSSPTCGQAQIQIQIEGLHLIEGFTIDRLNEIIPGSVTDKDSFSEEDNSYANDSMDKARKSMSRRQRLSHQRRVMARDSFISADSIDLAKKLKERRSMLKDRVPVHRSEESSSSPSRLPKEEKPAVHTIPSDLDSLVHVPISNRAA